MSTTAEKIAEYKRRIEVMKVPVDSTIQWITRECANGRWEDLPPECRDEFDWVDFDYRIKPKPREWWEVLDQYGNMRARRNQKQKAEEYISTYFVPAAEIVHVREVIDS